MEQRQCEKCGEMADEAKAFCPGCGSSFVKEEKRRTTSEFEMVESTVKLDHSMYNQMLSDMGLDLSKTSEKRVETVAPAVPRDAARQAPAASARPGQKNQSPLVWLIGLAVAVLALAFVVVAVAVVIFYLSAGRT